MDSDFAEKDFGKTIEQGCDVVIRRMEAIMAIEKISNISNVASSYHAAAKSAPTVEPVEAVAASASAAVNTPVVTEVSTAKNQNNGENGSQKEQQPSSERLKKAVSEINKKMNANTSCQFGIHEATNRVMIKLIDNDTREVIKEIPAEETLDIIAKAWELAGIMVDKKL